MIEYKNVSFAYSNEKIFDKINVQINDGEYVLVIGPNGAGKSTFIKCLLGLVKLTAGDILFDDVSINKFKNWDSIGYVAQRATHLQVTMPISVFEIVSMGKTGKTTQKEVLEKLAVVQMEQYLDENIHNLSGGQQQRIFIARALMSNPQVLILDEPTVGLDLASVKRFYELVAALHKQGKTIIMVTHDMHVLSAEASRIIAINKGIEFDGTQVDYQNWHNNLCLYCEAPHEHTIQGGDTE